jgi:hypothetical protein
MGSLDWDTVAQACLKFRSMIEAVVAGDSHFIEYLDSQYVPLLIFFSFVKSDDFRCAVRFSKNI